jgi:hypothetical protein
VHVFVGAPVALWLELVCTGSYGPQLLTTKGVVGVYMLFMLLCIFVFISIALAVPDAAISALRLSSPHSAQAAYATQLQQTPRHMECLEGRTLQLKYQSVVHVKRTNFLQRRCAPKANSATRVVDCSTDDS